MSIVDIICLLELRLIWENAIKIGIKKNINVWFLVNIWWNIKENVNKIKIKIYIKFFSLK